MKNAGAIADGIEIFDEPHQFVDHLAEPELVSFPEPWCVVVFYPVERIPLRCKVAA